MLTLINNFVAKNSFLLNVTISLTKTFRWVDINISLVFFCQQILSVPGHFYSQFRSRFEDFKLTRL